jgi:hypothetical protein
MLSLLSFKSVPGAAQALTGLNCDIVTNILSHGEHECCSDVQVLLLLNMSWSFRIHPKQMMRLCMDDMDIPRLWDAPSMLKVDGGADGMDFESSNPVTLPVHEPLSVEA